MSSYCSVKPMSRRDTDLRPTQSTKPHPAQTAPKSKSFPPRHRPPGEGLFEASADEEGVYGGFGAAEGFV